MSPSRSTLLVTALLVGASLAQPLGAQARGGGMRIYAGRSAPAATPSARPAVGPRLYEGRPAHHSRRHANRGGFRSRLHRGRPFILFALPFGYFAVDPWIEVSYDVGPATPPARRLGPSKVIELTRGAAGLEVRVRYADDRLATIPAADTLPAP